ncbi:GntR family transcriptional regulator [Georgenia yuyongxinii]|uniref:GntR family transcriptional regulator n=1 Tax=Georgenia yuyongxinii TaxID=2589797 RepID=UPI00163DDF22|nr:GntR family transcriptional regulator [Georgenia yuyongxinii]
MADSAMLDGGGPSGQETVGMADRIAAALRRKVASGELALGSWLRQSAIAEEFGTSRTPVREAIQALTATGVAELIPNRGARIRIPTAREIQEGYRVRAELEGLAASIAARYATQHQIERLREAEHLFEAAVADVVAGDEGLEEGRRRWTRANDEFHDIILDAARNRTLSAALEWLHLSLPRNLTWNELSRDPRLMQANVAQHHAIREAIERGDAAAAREAVIAHVMSSAEVVAIGLGDHS